MSLLASLPPQFNLPSVPLAAASPPRQPLPTQANPGDHDLLASLASIRSALATGKLQQHDVLRMLGDLSLAESAEPTPEEGGSGTSAALPSTMPPSAPEDDTARGLGSKSTSPGLERMQQCPLEQQLSGGSLQSGSTMLPASAAMINRLWHTSSAPVVAGGVHSTLMVG